MSQYSLDPAAAAELRGLVAEILAEVLPGLLAEPAASGPPGRRAPPAASVLAAGRRAVRCARRASGAGRGAAAGDAARPAGAAVGRARRAWRAPAAAAPARPAGGNGSGAPSGADSWVVRIETDDDLRDFALRVLKIADNPRLRRDLIGGRIRFRLAEQPAAAASRPAHRVDKGAVTERAVAAAAKAGARLVLGPRAVLTPLARDKARALGVPIEKER